MSKAQNTIELDNDTLYLKLDRMICTERFKYCIYKSDKDEESLVNMVKDPGGMQNLAANQEYKSVLAEHRKILADWMELSDDKDGLNLFKNNQ